MHGEAPPPFVGGEAVLVTKTMLKMIYRRYVDILGQPVAILDVPPVLSGHNTEG